MNNCLVCKENIIQRIQIEECLICSDRKANVLFKPCDHMIACDDCSQKLNIKKCLKCRISIDKLIRFAEFCDENRSEIIDQKHQFDELQAQSNDAKIKEQVK